MTTDSNSPRQPIHGAAESTSATPAFNVGLIEGKIRNRSLLWRVGALLSLALLPVGLVALIQTWRAVDASRDTYEATLRALTVRVAAPERRAINDTFGVARGVSDALAVLRPDAEACDALMKRTAATNPRLTFAGFVALDGKSECNATGEALDLSTTPTVQLMSEQRKPMVTYSPDGRASNQPVVIVSEPVFAMDGSYRGFVALSFNADLVSEERKEIELADRAVVLAINSRGEVLTSDVAREQLDRHIPAQVDLGALAGQGELLFRSRARDGTLRDFVVIPVAPGRAYVIGSWAPDAPGISAGPTFTASTMIFPALMWFVSLVVAMLALNRLVVRHIKDLRRRMRSFAEGRRIASPENNADTPLEFQEIGETFEAMAHQIVQDEAELEDAVFEREVLLREVHHRVKNNLQLISSIINMQVRQSGNKETEAALRRFQNRITSLAAVHRGLYEAVSVANVQMDRLLGDLIRQLGNLGGAREHDVQIARDIDPIKLVPDQAAPLAMLTTEAISNALKYGGAAEGDKRTLSISLKRVDEEGRDRASLEIVNSIGPGGAGEDVGLGRQLIAAFAHQLGASVEETSDGRVYRVALTFDIAELDEA